MHRSKRTGLKISSIVILCFLTLNMGFAQEECEDDISAKSTKLIEKGKNRKYNRVERIGFLNEALDNEESCLECNFLLGMEYYKKGKSGNSSFAPAIENYKRLVETCPEYHSDPYYYLGVMYYGQKRFPEALEYFQKYVAFPTDDDSKFSKDSQKMYDDTKEVIKELEFKASFFGNPVPFEPVKVNDISTSDDEYLPTLSPDNELIFFTRKRMHQAKGDLFAREIEELSLGKRPDMNSDFDKGEALEKPFNLGDNYGGISLSVNNKEMFITVCRPRMNGYNNCDIYVSRYERKFDEKSMSYDWCWSELESLGPNINTADGWEAQPSISGDGKTLYFATARETSIENSIDIYQSHRQEDGSWGPAEPFPGDLNTSGNEKSPFIHSDSKTLYFSCNARKGAGGYDIYYMRADENGEWTEPKNIGYPINSDKDEHGLIVSTDGSTAYYASNQIDGHSGYDIYRFEMPKDAKPESIVLLKGNVKKEEGESIEDVTVNLKNVNTQKVTEVELDQDDGTFAVVMNVEKDNYILEIEKEGAPFEAHVITKSEETVTKVEYEEKEITVGDEYVINDIRYATNSAEFDERSAMMLEAFAAYLIKNEGLKISIQGHTDDVGDDASNLALSAERAFQVKMFLGEKGVPSSRIEFKGMGESQPIADNTTEEGRAKNRRTTFKVIAY